jgi:hypothetical protein
MLWRRADPFAVERCDVRVYDPQKGGIAYMLDHPEPWILSHPPSWACALSAMGC